MIAIELQTGEILDDPGWDSFSPTALLDAGAQRRTTIVFARGGEPPPQGVVVEHEASSVFTWTLGGRAPRSLARVSGPFMTRSDPGHTFIALGPGEVLELPAEGKTRRISAALAPLLTASGPSSTTAADGERAPDTWVSGCGVDTIVRIGDRVLVDDGLNVWPS